ncbi:hypothetical protein Nepgr_010657 [Nepenthes gracilis]|uniref:Uncharacterized protein n=1 Tax=Nepenthes gracilis TaxID=150966 RepID=A0AAD3XL98_NEPGR|nr:hypothetical protein Nepgr_010657 [Nepenthes gracilis]
MPHPSPPPPTVARDSLAIPAVPPPSHSLPVSAFLLLLADGHRCDTHPCPDPSINAASPLPPRAPPKTGGWNHHRWFS